MRLERHGIERGFRAARRNRKSTCYRRKAYICSHNRNTSSWNSVWHRRSGSRSKQIAIATFFFQTQTVNSFHALTFERSPPESAQIQRRTNRVQLIWQCTDVFRVSTVSGSRTTPDVKQRITRVYTFTSRSCLRHSIKTTTIIMYRSLSFIIITLLFFSSWRLSIFNWNMDELPRLSFVM